MIKNKKVSSYLLYAVGEILLVVIGIVIAFQLDDLDRKNQNKKIIATYLNQIQEDIAENLRTIKGRDNFYGRYTKEINELINDQVPERDFYYTNVYNTGFQYSAISLKDKGYQNLISNINLTTSEHQEILSSLEAINKLNGFREQSVQQLGKLVTSYRDFLSRNQDWYWQLPSDSISPERITYFKNNVLHKNYLTRYKEEFQKEVWAAGFYGYRSHKLYYEIHSYLGKEESEVHEPIKDFYIKLDRDYLLQFEGYYDFSINIDEQVFIKVDSSNQLIFDNFDQAPLRPLDSAVFLLGNTRFEFDKNKGRLKAIFRGTTNVWNKKD